MGEYLNIMVVVHPPVKTGGLLATNFIKNENQAKIASHTVYEHRENLAEVVSWHKIK